ncbi:hypothetical protein HMI54_011276 [Coelomomyces lativittatus]|nr:hypothetical protein HMI54_011276 [Coelomomyces lativittatus]
MARAVGFLLLTILFSVSSAFVIPRGRANFLTSLAEKEGQFPKEQWFTQYIDHYNKADTRTWKQRYFVNDTFWNPSLGGPIFLQVGGEGAISAAYVVELEMAVFAQKYGTTSLANTQFVCNRYL